MKILVACERYGRVRDAMKAKGHDATSCDVVATIVPGQHIQDDVLNHLNDGWDMMIAHPDCTFLCNSGVRWLDELPNRWEQMEQAAIFFKRLLEAPIARIAIENPIPHKYALEVIGRKYDQIIQPWWFGEGETKATCLWLVNLPPLFATCISPERYQRVHLEPPSKDRGIRRSITYQGIAEAMAEQWGGIIDVP